MSEAQARKRCWRAPAGRLLAHPRLLACCSPQLPHTISASTRHIVKSAGAVGGKGNNCQDVRHLASLWPPGRCKNSAPQVHPPPNTLLTAHDVEDHQNKPKTN